MFDLFIHFYFKIGEITDLYHFKNKLSNHLIIALSFMNSVNRLKANSY